MFEPLGRVTLKTGETVEAAVIHGPDATWCDRLEKLLRHKGEPWNWQNSALLRAATGVASYFYVLHRDGQPLAHQMTAEINGVGLFGHVWTEPADRGKGAASLLMAVQMAHFQNRGGQALVLGTNFDTPAYHIYVKHGFQSVEPGSGVMTWTRHAGDDFRTDYFAPSGHGIIEPLAWHHWPTVPILFTGKLPGAVRSVALGLWGLCNTEEPLLHCLHDAARPKVNVLRLPNGAVAGLAACGADPIDPGATCVDHCVHPAHRGQADNLWAAALQHVTATARLTAYADAQQPERIAFLERHGFHHSSSRPEPRASDGILLQYTYH